MAIKRYLSSAVLCAALVPPVGACLSGWDCCKWNDPNHLTPKYVVGRTLAAFPHTPAGLKQALPFINAVYPGTVILPGKGDKVRIPCVGVVDLIVAAGAGGERWWWGADAAGNECGKCTPNRCEDVSKSKKCGGESGGGSGLGFGAGAGSSHGGAATNCAGVKVPNRLSVVQQTAADNPDAWRAKLDPREMEVCRPDSRYLDLVVDNLRREDKRWGFNCKRGNCGDPSHDVIAYYFGQGEAYEGAPQVMLVDMIQDTCAPGAKPNWLVLEPNFGNGSGAGWTSKGRFKSGPRQNVVMNCPLKGEPATASSFGGGGGALPSRSPAPSSSSSAPNSAPKKNDGSLLRSGGKPSSIAGPGAAEEPPVQAPAPEAAPGPASQEEEAEEEPE